LVHFGFGFFPFVGQVGLERRSWSVLVRPHVTPPILWPNDSALIGFLTGIAAAAAGLSRATKVKRRTTEQQYVRSCLAAIIRQRPQ